MESKITFCGGTGSVTGANFLVESGDFKFLVDCGLAQGMHNAEEVNWEPFQYDPASIPLLIVTHAHIDHIGKIPKLVKDGFKGKIISTEPTRAMAEPLLLDSMELLAHDAMKHGREELYDKHDIAQALSLWEGMPYHESRELGGGFTIELLDAGHILGSAMVKVSRGDACMVFTGDLGGGNSALLAPHDKIGMPNYLLMESVYGNRTRPNDENHIDELMRVINETTTRGGTVLIPAFSTERTQDLIFEIRELMEKQKIPQMPVFIDSPLAQKITEAYLAYPQYFSKEIQERIKNGEHIFSFPNLHMVENTEESRALAHKGNPKIIIAGSGMSNGGRVHAHEQEILPDAKSTVVIVGYQAAGSLGRRLVERDKNVYIMGQRVKVAAKIETIYGYSAHMDGQQLLDFVAEGGEKLKEVFVVMGEPASSGFLAQRIRDYLGIKAIAPAAKDSATVEL